MSGIGGSWTNGCYPVRKKSSSTALSSKKEEGFFLGNKDAYASIEEILALLNGDLLAGAQCFLAGGTAVAIQNDYYRKSLDIDFVVSSVEGYKRLREIVLENPSGIFKSPPNFLREPISDRYGIRMVLGGSNGEPVKFEIVSIANGVNLNPDTDNKVLGLLMPTRTDYAWLKLLANDDRGADSSVLSRDIFDIAILGLDEDELREAYRKALTSYSSAVARVNTRATELLDDEKLMKERMEKLSIDLSLFDFLAFQLEKIRDVAKEY